MKKLKELMERRAQLALELEKDGADLDAIETELRQINEEIERRRAEDEREDRSAQMRRREEIRRMVANGAGAAQPVTQDPERRNEPPTEREVRSSAAYVNAWCEEIRNGGARFRECRRLLTENGIENATDADGIVPVPTYVEDRIRAIFENNSILNRVRKTFFRGNYEVGFEVYSSGAVDHEEGSGDIDDEELIFGVVSLIPKMIKKIITISDMVLDLRGEEFMAYLMDEFENKIMSQNVARVINAILDAPEKSDETHVGVPTLEAAVVSLDTVSKALALLKDDDARPTLTMSRSTYAAFRATQLNANYAVDPFEGLEIEFTSKLPDVGAAEPGETWMLVNDYDAVQANYPNGYNVRFIIDELTKKRSDMVELLGKLNVAVAITAPGKTVRVAMPEE